MVHDNTRERSPEFFGDEPNRYYGYFENHHGEQAIFVYDRGTGRGVRWCGEAGWESPRPVVDERVEGMILNKEEQDWPRVCWQAAAG